MSIAFDQKAPPKQGLWWRWWWGTLLLFGLDVDAVEGDIHAEAVEG